MSLFLDVVVFISAFLAGPLAALAFWVVPNSLLLRNVREFYFEDLVADHPTMGWVRYAYAGSLVLIPVLALFSVLPYLSPILRLHPSLFAFLMFMDMTLAIVVLPAALIEILSGASPRPPAQGVPRRANPTPLRYATIYARWVVGANVRICGFARLTAVLIVVVAQVILLAGLSK